MTSTELRTVRGSELVNIRRPGLIETKQLRDFSRAKQFVQPIPLTMGEGERLILATRMHWCLPLKAVTKSIVAMPVALALSVFLDVVAHGVPYLQLILWGIAGLHEMHWAYQLVGWRTHLLVVTSNRVLSTEGIVRRRLKEINIGRRTNLEVEDQSIFGRILNYGQFRVEMAGVHDDGAQREKLRFIPDPFGVYNAMITHAAHG